MLDVPEEPILELVEGEAIAPGPLTVREKHLLSVRCVVKGALPVVNRISWFLGEENVTHHSQLLMAYSADDDNYVSQSLLAINVTKEFDQRLLICQAEHIAWKRYAEASAALNVLCKYHQQRARKAGRPADRTASHPLHAVVATSHSFLLLTTIANEPGH